MLRRKRRARGASPIFSNAAYSTPRRPLKNCSVGESEALGRAPRSAGQRAVRSQDEFFNGLLDTHHLKPKEVSQVLRDELGLVFLLEVPQCPAKVR